MEPVSLDLVQAAVKILGAQAYVDDAIEARVRALVTEDSTARRLIDMLAEAFGIVVISHMPESSGMTLPTTFCARDASGRLHVFPIKSDPVFVLAIEIAQFIFHHGPRHLIKNIANRSAMINTISGVLNDGGSLEGSTLGGPEFLGVPASLYAPALGTQGNPPGP